MLTIWPSTRLFTVTVLRAVTEPNPRRYTGMSPWVTLATTTGTAFLPPLPLLPPDPEEAATACAGLPVKYSRKYQAAPPRRPKTIIHEIHPLPPPEEPFLSASETLI